MTTVEETTITRTTPDNSVEEVCQTWTIWGSSCYLYVNTSAPSWDAAVAQCLTYHNSAHLVFIGSASENDFVKRLVGPGKYPWIGVTEIEGEWVWSTQGIAVDATLTYSNWVSNYNSHADQDCGFLQTNNGKWQSHKCNAEDVFVCELEQ
ncbi:Lectin BRA-3 [Holothuria leucospilota]|uniref:Lectin BRA-3 n=1 Tax=Holothuria leucospilota TaxID=206669 RepID=A0A9Q1BFJ4_HOLLE|nr:Lectin BRA-3 [Holothuria leucospilota]